MVEREEFKGILADYRVLVDELITSHMVDLGINEEQFAQACELAEGMLGEKFKQILFEELWAAENYEIFVRLMTKRNVELQLEALYVLLQKHGLVYDAFVPIGAKKDEFLSEDHVMREAILRSLNDLEVSPDSNTKITRKVSLLGGLPKKLSEQKENSLKSTEVQVDCDDAHANDEMITVDTGKIILCVYF